MGSDHTLDVEKVSLDGAIAPVQTGEDLTIDPAVEKRLLRKTDIYVVPILGFMYLFNSLDKGNLANAQTDGFATDVGLVGNQYFLLVMIFFVPFCSLGVPLSLVAKRFSAARVLPIAMLVFGTLAMCSAAVKKPHAFADLLAIRILLGAAESCFFPSVIYYLSMFYNRGELASRLGIFYAASTASGAFSGLIAFGVFQIKDGALKGWQYLFLIEGAFTVAFAIFGWFYLPHSPAKCWFYDDEMKECARRRALRDSVVEIEEKISIGAAFKPFVQDWRYGVWALLAICLGVPLFSVSNFLPQIVARFGYSSVKTNLYTVAPNLVGTLFLVCVTQSSDYFRERSFHIVVPVLITFIGFIILGTINVVEHQGVSYFACFLLCMGSGTPSVMTSTWYTNNSLSESTRALQAGIMVGIANAAGLISTNIFKAKDAPKYLPALIITAAFGGVTALIAATWGLYMRWENRRRNKAQGLPPSHGSKDVPTVSLKRGPSDPAFRYFY